MLNIIILYGRPIKNHEYYTSATEYYMLYDVRTHRTEIVVNFIH